MGSVISGIGNAVGSVFGGIGGGVAQGAGATNNYQVSNPYGQQQLQNELNQQSDIYANQQNLAQALQAQMNGQGPNPAQSQYLGNVQNNIANTQGLIASQRGLNPALAARMGANQASASNNQAALASALLQQQQQLGATANLGNLYGQEQQGNLGAQQLYNQAALGTQQLGASVAGQNAQIRGQLAGGVLNAAGGAGAALAAAHGAVVPGSAKVAGNSPSNDTVPAMLSPGEIVIDREHLTSRKKAHAKLDDLLDQKDGQHDHKKTMGLVDHLMKQKKPKTDYKDVLAARRKRKAA